MSPGLGGTSGSKSASAGRSWGGGTSWWLGMEKKRIPTIGRMVYQPRGTRQRVRPGRDVQDQSSIRFKGL